MATYLITGAAGFIGSTMADRLLADGHHVIGIDNFSTGFERFQESAKTSPNYRFFELDLTNQASLMDAFSGDIDCVFHFAANADVRSGLNHPEKDLQQNTIATFNVLEAMRHNQVRRIVFSSTGSIYGEPKEFPTSETTGFPIQTSLYGASKLAGEGLIQSYCEGYGFQGYIFRFVSILGERYTHGHVFDFFQKLTQDPTRLPILGNGKQQKSYLYIQDCLDAILLALEKAQDKVNIFNLGTPEYINVDFSAGVIAKHLGLTPTFEYSGGERGWVGDSPFIFLDVAKIMALGWKPKLSIQQALIKTISWLQQNTWVYEERECVLP